ncbi:hypothetical protein ccbrp13_31140 [Ktedonobacteria bacterium brp13]|nr:hypothetical protein ccbrp13_31140 [Ktedonobacteria bacterium brp13]
MFKDQEEKRKYIRRAQGQGLSGRFANLSAEIIQGVLDDENIQSADLTIFNPQMEEVDEFLNELQEFLEYESGYQGLRSVSYENLPEMMFHFGGNMPALYKVLVLIKERFVDTGLGNLVEYRDGLASKPISQTVVATVQAIPSGVVCDFYLFLK